MTNGGLFGWSGLRARARHLTPIILVEGRAKQKAAYYQDSHTQKNIPPLSTVLVNEKKMIFPSQKQPTSRSAFLHFVSSVVLLPVTTRDLLDYEHAPSRRSLCLSWPSMCCNMSALYDSCQFLLSMRHRDFLHPNLKVLLSPYAIVPALSHHLFSLTSSCLLQFPFPLPLSSLVSVSTHPTSDTIPRSSLPSTPMKQTRSGPDEKLNYGFSGSAIFEPSFLFLFCLNVARVIAVLQYQHTPL